MHKFMMQNVLEVISNIHHYRIILLPICDNKIAFLGNSWENVFFAYYISQKHNLVRTSHNCLMKTTHKKRLNKTWMLTVYFFMYATYILNLNLNCKKKHHLNVG